MTESTLAVAGLGGASAPCGDRVSCVTTTDAFAALARRAVRASVLLGALLVALAAAPAHADMPEGWAESTDVDGQEALLLLVGVPLLMFVVISVLVVLPALIRGERVLPDHGAADAEWIGGPRQGTDALPAAEETRSGGASGSW